VTGATGTGKTIFGLQFLLASEGSSKPLCVSFAETEQHLRENAASLGMRTDDIEFLDLTADADIFSEIQSYDIFSPSEIEREPIARSIRTRIEQLDPDRIFIDGFSQIRTICSDKFQFLRMTQSLFRFAENRSATLLVSANDRMIDRDILEDTSDGIIRLSRRAHLRTLEVVKFRGSAFVPDRHPMRISTAGLEIFAQAV
jgi:circadian clock protein KaiC